jgi:hypothetical protein
MLDLDSKTFLGIVEENLDPRKLGRCRIRVINIFDNLRKEDIPWAKPWKDLNGNSFMVPEIGKIVTVIFDQGNIYSPEYIYAEHYNLNLQNKLNTLEGDNYASMKALIFDHKTQIYVNDEEGLLVEHHYNNMNIQQNSISLNLKDNNSSLLLGDENGDQQAILGNHFFDWFDVFMDKLMYAAYCTDNGPPICPQPDLVDVYLKYKELRDPVFLSKHVRIVDNDKVTVNPNKSESFPVHRENFGIAGDLWRGTSFLNKLTKRLKDIPRPWKKRKKRLDAKYKSPQDKKPIEKFTSAANSPNSSESQTSTPPINNPLDPQNSKPTTGAVFNAQNTPGNNQNYPGLDPTKRIEFYEEEDEITRLEDYIDFKIGASPITGRHDDYILYEDPYVLNIIAFRNRKHEYGQVTNRFDDVMYVFFKNEKRQWEPIRKYSITTMPGWKVVDGKRVDPPILDDGSSFINYGQYVNAYKYGYHNQDDYGKRHPCLVCDKVGIRLNKKKGKYIQDKYVNTNVASQIGPDVDGWVFGGGMNIHCAIPMDESVYGTQDHPRASTIYDEVNNWSKGCIVFNNPSQYREFLGLCEEQRIKAKKSQFTVTVASLREYEIFDTDEGIDGETDFNLPLDDRFPDFDGDFDNEY